MKRWLAVFLVVLSASISAQSRSWPSERPPRALAAHEIKFPPYAIRTLANGLQVVAVSHHEEPVVSLRLIVRAGAAPDPGNRPGVAAMAASLLDQGTATRSAEQIASTIDSIGGALGTGAGPGMTSINAVVMKDSLGLGLDLVSDLAQHPSFSAEELERQRQQSLSGMRVGYDDPEFLANVVFDRLVYGFHPYGRPQSGTPETVAALTRDDLLTFHKRWFGANNAILAVVGDVSADEAFAGAERAFASWGKVDVQTDRGVEPPPPARRLVVIDKPGAVQTEIRVGNIAIPRKHDDFMAFDLASKILGGEGANRLHRVLRSERGLTYGASADFNALKETGEIVAQTNTRSATTGETLRLMVDEVWKLQRDRGRRPRAHGRPVVPDRIVSDHYRDAQPDRDADSQRGVLRAQPQRPRHIPRARERRIPGRHSARRPHLLPSRQTDDRAGRRRVSVRQAAPWRGLRQLRRHSGVRP
jgi:zinc protease